MAAALIAVLSGCGGDSGSGEPSGDSTATQDTAQDVLALIEQSADDWLGGFSAPTPVECPPNSDAVINATDSSMEGCAFYGSDGGFYVRVHNLSSVPMSVWGRANIDPVYTVLPGASLDLLITNPEFGQYLSYQADTVAGLTSVVVEQVESELDRRRAPGYEWLACAAQPDAECVLDGLTSLLPEEVVIRGHEIPLRTLVEGLSLAYENRDLLSSFEGDVLGSPPGTLTISQRP